MNLLNFLSVLQNNALIRGLLVTLLTQWHDEWHLSKGVAQFLFDSRAIKAMGLLVIFHVDCKSMFGIWCWRGWCEGKGLEIQQGFLSLNWELVC